MIRLWARMFGLPELVLQPPQTKSMVWNGGIKVKPFP